MNQATETKNRLQGELELLRQRVKELEGALINFEEQDETDTGASNSPLTIASLSDPVSILESISEAFFALDRDWHFTYLNSHAQKLLFNAKGNLLGRNFWEVFSELPGSTFYKEFHLAVNSGTAVSFEEFYPPLNKWFEVHAYPFGEGILVNFNDISALKRTEPGHTKQHTQLSAILDSAVEGIFGMDEQANCTFINHAALKLLGYTEEECLGKNMHTLTHYKRPDGSPYPIEDCPINRAMTLGEPARLIEEVLWQKDGSPVPSLYSCAPILENGRVVGGVVSIVDISKEKRTEALLREHQELHRAVWEVISDGIAISNANGTVLAANPAYFKLYGYRPEEIIGKDFSIIFPPQVRESARKQYREVFSSEKITPSFESLAIRGDGTQRIVDAGYDFISVNGERTAMISVVRDITERRLAEKERDTLMAREGAVLAQLRKSETYIKRLVESNIIGIVLADLDGRITEMNEAFLAIVGYSREDFLAGKVDWRSITPPEYLPLDEQALQELATRGECTPFEKEYIRKDGSRVPILIGAAVVEKASPEKMSWVCFILDVTERKRAEEKLRFLVEASEVLTSSLDYAELLKRVARLGVAHLGNYCVFDLADEENPGSFERIALAHSGEGERQIHYRYTPTQNLLYPPLRVFETAQPVLISEVTDETLHEYARDGEHLRLLQEVRARSIISVPLLVRGRTIGVLSFISSDPAQHYTQADLELLQELGRRCAVAIDNSRLYKEARQATRTQEELNRLKDFFMSVAGHELRTPLTSIKGYGQILQRALEKTGKGGEEEGGGKARLYVDNILNQADRMNRLVGQLMDFSRIQNQKLELDLSPGVNLYKFLGQVLEQQQITAKDHKLLLEASNPSITATCDVPRLEQVFHNLLNNAIKYSPAGTTVTVGLEEGGNSGEALIWVKDQGQGIGKEELARIFERFYRSQLHGNSRVEGLGLGLYISHEIISQHGGKMWVESELGKGSTFYVSLPLGPALPDAAI